MAWSKQKPGHTVARGFGLSLWPRHTSFFYSSEISFEHVPPPPIFLSVFVGALVSFTIAQDKPYAFAVGSQLEGAEKFSPVAFIN